VTTPTSLSLVVFAGGEGRRLGGLDKARLLDGAGRARLTALLTTLAPAALAARLAARGEPAVVDAVVITRPERRACHAALCPRETRFVVDPGGGPARALAAGLPALTSEWLWLVGVDQHRMSAEVLEAVWAQRADVDVVLPRAGGFAQPLGALARRGALIATPPRAGLASWLSATARVGTWEGEAAWFEGLDTPEALEAAGWRPGGAVGGEDGPAGAG
jgi:molybdopterin-guanine dinucleotide biosynthesis protein A